MELSSQVLRAAQLASLGLTCLGTKAEARPLPVPAPTASPSSSPASTPESASAPLPELSSKVREKLRVAANREARMEERVSAIRAIQALKDQDAVYPLLMLYENSGNEKIRAALRAALERLSASELLAADLSHAHPGVRKRALDLLRVWCEPKDGKSSAVFQAALSDSDPKVRSAAATALGRCGSAGDVAGLIRLLTADPEADVRSAAAQALGNFDEARVRPALESARTTEKDEFVQVFIRMALRQLSASEDSK